MLSRRLSRRVGVVNPNLLAAFVPAGQPFFVFAQNGGLPSHLVRKQSSVPAG
jgi:hypothetical protein